MDCSFITQEGCFNFRVGAIIVQNNKILMTTNKNDSFYYSVGGRVKMNETIEEAVRREVFEETGNQLEIDRLAFINENFFTDKSNNQKYHEISFYFIMKTTENLTLMGKSYTQNNIEEVVEWLPLDKLDEYTIFPDFLKTQLNLNENQIRHIVTYQ